METENKITIRSILKHCKKTNTPNYIFFDNNTFYINTFSGKYLVKSIDNDCWVHTPINSFCCHYDTELIKIGV